MISGDCSGQTVDRSQRRREQLNNQRDAVFADFRFELSELSKACYDQGLESAAKDITHVSLQLTRPSGFTAPPRLMMLPVNRNLPVAEKQWRLRLRTLREEAAEELYRLARSALRNENLPSLAYSLVQDALRFNPDHEYARAIIGHQSFHDRKRQDDPTYAGEWVSPFEAQKRSGTNPETFDPRFGWIRESQLNRYEAGERLWKGTWVSAIRESELRRNFRNAWEVESEHFLVKTNTSLEEGVSLSMNLEMFYHWMQTNLAAFFDTPAALKERFENAQLRRGRTTSAKPMQVHYFAERSEYERAVRDYIPAELIPRTNGFYWDKNQTCYLFRSGDETTVFHEATHQILDLHTRKERYTAARARMRLLRQRTFSDWVLCEKDNFWIIEGLACYFESFTVSNSNIEVGSPDHPRFVAAQFRLLTTEPDKQFYLPLRAFCSLGTNDFQRHRNISQLYSQASGLTHFLLHYDDGRYRDAFVELLAAVYRPDARNPLDSPSLDTITGVSFETLDTQYREHMTNLALELQDQVGQ